MPNPHASQLASSILVTCCHAPFLFVHLSSCPIITLVVRRQAPCDGQTGWQPLLS